MKFREINKRKEEKEGLKEIKKRRKEKRTKE